MYGVIPYNWGTPNHFCCSVLLCDGATYGATEVKRWIDYPSQGKPYNILPPFERRDIWEVSVDGSPYSVVRAYPNFDPNPGDPGRHVYNKTHAQAFLLKEMFKVGFELLVSSTMPNVMVLPTELPG